MYYIGLDVHKKTISYCVKDVSGQHLPGREGRRDSLGTRHLDQDSTAAMDSSHGGDHLHGLDL